MLTPLLNRSKGTPVEVTKKSGVGLIIGHDRKDKKSPNRPIPKEVRPTVLRSTGPNVREMTAEVFMNMLTHSGDTGGAAGFQGSPQGKQLAFREIGLFRGRSDGVGVSSNSALNKPSGLKIPQLDSMFTNNPESGIRSQNSV